MVSTQVRGGNIYDRREAAAIEAPIYQAFLIAAYVDSEMSDYLASLGEKERRRCSSIHSGRKRQADRAIVDLINAKPSKPVRLM